MDKKHIAFKCTYNNGDEGEYVGFNGTCTEGIIKWNIKDGRYWCNEPKGKCKEYYINGFKGRCPRPSGELCYESVLFKYWKYGAGWDQRGIRGKVPRHINQTDIGKISILTTRFPNEPEIDRRIIGLYKIGNITNNFNEETFIEADSDYRIRLPMEEAKQLYFWDYFRNEHSDTINWGHGLFRYLSDIQSAQILKDIFITVKDENTKNKLNELLNQIINQTNIQKISTPSGPRMNISGNRSLRVSIERKYGYGGEGQAHKNLKNWIAQNPDFLGLKNVQNIENDNHRFPSGDLPDIIFECKNNKYTIVEIETQSPFPGAYQAIKYRSLLCAELGISLDSENVKTVLVAWEIPNEIRDFCDKYNVKFYEKRL